jgi:hypothetical protein
MLAKYEEEGWAVGWGETMQAVRNNAGNGRFLICSGSGIP